MLRMVEPSHRLEALSFAARTRNDLIDLWAPSDHVEASGNALGRERARELLAYMKANDAPFLLGHVVARIVERGGFGALEVGFFHGIAAAALAGTEAVAPRSARSPNLRLIGGGPDAA